MLKLLVAPATNDRSPRYMERALAAIHQADRARKPITLLYASMAGRVGLFMQFDDAAEERIAGPVAANYPNCELLAAKHLDQAPSGWETRSATLALTPEIFPILRHAQFEDLLNRTFADPINGILRAIQPSDTTYCHIAVQLSPATHRRRRLAENSVRLLDREFFRRHHRLAEYFAEHITRRGWFAAWILGILARQSPHPTRTTLETSSSRLHDREEKLQAASDKLGGHLFETHIRVVVHPQF